MATSADLTDTVQLLDSADLKAAEDVKVLILNTLKTNKEAWLLNSIIDFFLVSHSQRCLTILENVREPHDKQTFDRLVECIKGQHKLPAINIIGHLVSRPPPWLHKITNHSLMKHLINVMKIEMDVPILVSAVLAVTSLLPIVPVSVQSYIQDILDAFIRLAAFDFKKHNQVPDIYLLHLHAAIYSLFHRIYGMFPCHLIYYLRSYCGKKDNQGLFDIKIAPMLERVRMHPLLITASKDKEVSRERWRQKEVHDIIVDCARLSLDIIEGSKERCDFLFADTSLHGQSSDTPTGLQVSVGTVNVSSTSQALINVHDFASSMWSPSMNLSLSTPPPGAVASTSANILDGQIASHHGPHLTTASTTPYTHDSPYPMVEPTTPVLHHQVELQPMMPAAPTTPGAANKRLSAMSLSLAGKGPPTPTTGDPVPPSPQRFDFSVEPPLHAQKLQAVRKLNFLGQMEDPMEVKTEKIAQESASSENPGKEGVVAGESDSSVDRASQSRSNPASPSKRKRPPPLKSFTADTFDFGAEDDMQPFQESAEAMEDVESSPSVPSVNQLPDIIGNLQKENVPDVTANDEEVQKLTDSSEGLERDSLTSTESSPRASAMLLTAQSVQAFMKNVKRIRFNSMNVGKLREISQDSSEMNPKRSRSNSCPDLDTAERDDEEPSFRRQRSNSGSGSSSSEASFPAHAKTPTKSASGISFTAEQVIEEEDEVDIKVTPTGAQSISPEDEQEKIQNFLTMFPYHHLFQISLPVAPFMKCYLCRHKEVDRKVHSADDMPFFTSYSPPDLLDRHLKLSSELHADQLNALESATATSPPRRSFGSSTAYPKGLSTSDEMKIMRGEIQLLHNQVMYERQKRELYAKRNRRLLGKITKATALEEQNSAMQDQLRLKENEVTNLHVTVSLQQKQVHDLQQAKEKLEKEKMELQKSLHTDVVKLQSDKHDLQNILDTKLRENEDLRRDLQSSKAQMFNFVQELAALQTKADFAAELQDQVVCLNKELLLMGELQQKYRQRLVSSATMHNPKPEMQFLLDTYKQELASTKSALTQKSVHYDALAAYRSQQDEQMAKKDALIAEQRRTIESSNAMFQAQHDAAEEKYRAQCKITAAMSAQILELTAKLEEFKKPEKAASGGMYIGSGPDSGDEQGATGGDHSPSDSHIEEMKIEELHEDNRPAQANVAPPLDAAVLQQHATATDGAFQSFMAAREQTYKQFMEAFMELKPEDVARFNNQHRPQSTTRTPPAVSSSSSAASSMSASSATSTGASSNSSSASGKPIVSPDNSTLPAADQDSDLEEEVIDEGELIPSRLMRPESPGRLKLDNFVDDEEGFSSNDEELNEYQASFNPLPMQQKLEKTSATPTQASHSKSSNAPQNSADVSDDSSTSSDEPQVSASDNTESLNAHKPSPQEISEPVATTDESNDDRKSPLTSQAAIDTLKNQANLSSTRSGFGPRTVAEALREEFPDSEPIRDNTDVIDPSRIKGLSGGGDSDEEGDEQLVYDATLDEPNPGEVENDLLVPSARKKTTCLEFTVLTEESRKEDIQKQSAVTCEDSETDTVEAFALDEDFDYDNVILTPKYTPGEMAVLQDLMKTF